MGHAISNLALGVGQSFLCRREGVGHVCFINHISKCSGPPPPPILFDRSLNWTKLSSPQCPLHNRPSSYILKLKAIKGSVFFFFNLNTLSTYVTIINIRDNLAWPGNSEKFELWQLCVRKVIFLMSSLQHNALVSATLQFILKFIKTGVMHQSWRKLQPEIITP